jgi:hypothetical protein
VVTIAFDGACLGDGPITGVARSFLNGLAAYAARGEHDCVLLVPEGTKEPSLLSVRCIAAPRGAVRRQLALPRILRRLDAALLHSSVAAVPLRAGCPTIATVHDLPWLHPELDETSTPWRRFATRRALASASAVLAPSLFTANDVRSLLGTRCPPLSLVPHGTPLGAPPSEPDTDARSGPLLVLGDDRPRKNRARVRAAHALAVARCPALPALRFVGPPDDYVDEAEKLRLLRTCRAVVQGSVFEGFGMPVLEALAQGAPLACSDLPPFREIAHTAALYFNPRDPESIALAMIRVHTDSALRRTLALEGFRSACFAQPAEVARRWAEVHAFVQR